MVALPSLFCPSALLRTKNQVSIMSSMLIRAVVALSCLFPFIFSAAAHEFKLGDLVLLHPWTRATAPGAPVAGGYVTITNTGTAPDRLVSGSFEASASFEIHEMTMEGDIMKMAELPNGLEIPAGQTITLKPGGLHMMFIGLKTPLAEGAKVKGTLVFEKAGKVDVEFVVEARGAKGGADKTMHEPGMHGADGEKKQ
jgi:periplasmic copper chaperone A